MRRLPTFVPALLLGTLVLLAHDAGAQIRRCTAADGKVIYTDRKCEDVQAVEHRPDTDASGIRGPKSYARGCSRNVRDLIYEVTASIDSHDVNRLAAVYHWTGVSSSRGDAVMRSLESISNRPLSEVRAVLPAPHITVRADGSTTLSGNVDASGYARATIRRAPVGLRLEQSYPGTIRPVRTVFGLRQNMGCWFVTL